MKSIKEKQLLVKWARAMNEPIDEALVEEVERYERTFKAVVESVKQNSISDLAQAAKAIPAVVIEETTSIEYPKPPSLEDVMKLVEQVEQPVIETNPPKPVTLVDAAVEHITKEAKLEEKADSYQQPNAELPARSINDIRKKIKFLEDWISKISITGPGGGAGDVINLDHPVKLVTGDYTLTRNDYYVGVNAAATVNITIPNVIGHPGRRIIIKDESGRCSKFPIIVSGNVDGDPGGFILRIDNGAIQMIYREGWRIV